MQENVLVVDSFQAAYEAAASGKTIVQEQVEQPAAEPETETQPETETAKEEPLETIEDAPAKEVPEVTERVVEKVVEKYPEFKDESSKHLFEAFVNGEEDKILNYLLQKNKDYKSMSDTDVIRENIKGKNPDWTAAEVELDLRDFYGEDLEKIDINDFDPVLNKELINEANIHNKQVEKNLIKLARDARDARHELIKKQQNIELPKITQPVTETKPVEISEKEKQAITEQWEQRVATEIPKLPDLKLKVDDKEVVYKQTEEGKKALAERVKNFNLNAFLAERWYNEDGTSNVVNLAKDLQLLYESDKIFKSFATQIKSSNTKDVIKDIKNYDSNKQSSSQPAAPLSFVDSYYSTKR